MKQQSREKLFFLAGTHSRNSSTSSSEPDLRDEKAEEKKRCHVTGGCLCKISLLVYLAVCILVSALYVAIYGQNQQPFGEVWIPGKVGRATPTKFTHKTFTMHTHTSLMHTQSISPCFSPHLMNTINPTKVSMTTRTRNGYLSDGRTTTSHFQTGQLSLAVLVLSIRLLMDVWVERKGYGCSMSPLCTLP